jgi:hypothetical protein
MFRRKISLSSSGSKSKTNKEPAEAVGKLSLSPSVFGFLRYEGNMFLRNVELCPDYKLLQPGRPHSA